MTYWDLLVREVMNKYQTTATFYFITRPKVYCVNEGMDITYNDEIKVKVKRQFCFLGPMYPGVKFSPQECACMKLALKDKSIKEIAKILELSPRTVEFYFAKMRQKLQCKNRIELIAKVLESDFLKNQ